MSLCWRITCPGGTGYTTSSNVHEFVEKNVLSRQEHKEWKTEKVSLDLKYQEEDDGLQVEKMTGMEAGWITKGLHAVLNKILSPAPRVVVRDPDEVEPRGRSM